MSFVKAFLHTYPVILPNIIVQSRRNGGHVALQAFTEMAACLLLRPTATPVILPNRIVQSWRNDGHVALQAFTQMAACLLLRPSSTPTLL